MSSTINLEGQITIPRAFLEQLGLSPGDDVALELQSDREIVLTKATGEAAVDSESYRRRLESVRGAASVGLSTDEIMKLTRGDD